MRSRGYGRIVNIASVAGKEGNPNMVGYSASKAALIGLTNRLPRKSQVRDICINAVSPAVIRTKILEQLTPDQVAYMVDAHPDEAHRTARRGRGCRSLPCQSAIVPLSPASATT